MLHYTSVFGTAEMLRPTVKELNQCIPIYNRGPQGIDKIQVKNYCPKVLLFTVVSESMGYV